ncbi:MAG: DUF2200 domain-containing protein, partial [Planctomycetes bacterium]|nr:DUF2200 domain-containing protein [Planctomycetota bacterium]
MKWAKVYPLLVAKVVKKGRSEEEVHEVIEWLMGYDAASIAQAMEDDSSVKDFYDNAPKWNPNASLIKGVVCGVRVEEVEEPTMRRIRFLDKLIDELAK